jgi:hypothetical protein
VTQNVYGKSWWEERVDAMTRAVEAVSAAQNAENAEVKKDQPEAFSNEWVPLWRHSIRARHCLLSHASPRLPHAVTFPVRQNNVPHNHVRCIYVRPQNALLSA